MQDASEVVTVVTIQVILVGRVHFVTRMGASQHQELSTNEFPLIRECKLARFVWYCFWNNSFLALLHMPRPSNVLDAHLESIELL